MRAILVFALFAFAVAHAELAPEIEYYTTADDHLDIQTVIGEIARMKRFIDCFLDRAPCSVRTASYKKIIPDALATNCKKCNDLQKHMANAFLKGLKDVLPEDYTNFRKKYDPENNFFDDFERSIEAY